MVAEPNASPGSEPDTAAQRPEAAAGSSPDSPAIPDSANPDGAAISDSAAAPESAAVEPPSADTSAGAPLDPDTRPSSAGSSEVGHTHADVSGGWLRPAVFGAMDGLVTNIALVAGVGGAGADRHMLVLSGTAGLIAGAFSMALGEYVSVDTQNNSVRSEMRKERTELVRDPDGERSELAGMYQEDGMTPATAGRAAAEIHRNTDRALRTHVVHELGVDPDEQPSPWIAAISSFCCFAVGALLPLLPFLLGVESLGLGLLAGAAGLFVTGAVVARFTTRPWWWNGTRQLLFGALAAGATYLVGSLIGVSAA